jgi:hypothetical protein
MGGTRPMYVDSADLPFFSLNFNPKSKRLYFNVLSNTDTLTRILIICIHRAFFSKLVVVCGFCCTTSSNKLKVCFSRLFCFILFLC